MLKKLASSNKYGLAKYRIPMPGSEGYYAFTRGMVSHHGVVLFVQGKPFECYDLGKDENTKFIKTFSSTPDQIEQHLKKYNLEPQKLEWVDLEQGQIYDIKAKIDKVMSAINESQFKYVAGQQDCQWFAETIVRNPENLNETLQKIKDTKDAQENPQLIKKIWQELWKYESEKHQH